MHLSNRTKGLLIISATALVIAVIRSKFAIKIPEAPDKAIEKGKSITENPGKILAISAHPDDLEFFAGGLLTLLQSKGHEVHIIDVTDGEKGTRVKDLARTRRIEQLKAGRALGVDKIVFLHLPDLRLEQVDRLNIIIKEQIEKIRPDIILTFDCYKPIRAIIHPDHIKVGKSTAEAVMLLDDRKPDLIYYASREPNSVVDISNALGRKIRAVQSHRSQIRFSTKPYISIIKAFARYNSLNTGIKYAESFRIENYYN